MLIEFLKFLGYLVLIIIISKYVLVITLRKLAESLNLRAKTVGNVAGYATSLPEFLTITASSLRGLPGASVYNIISSNIINFVQYIGTMILNKNTEKLRNKAIVTDLILVIFTIIIPIILLIFKIEFNLVIVPAFVVLYAFFRYLNNNVHKLYLQKEDKEIEEEIEKEEKWERENKFKIIKYSLYLLITGVILYFIGDALGNTLENLCKIFNISEVIIGILLGLATSIPELMTFFESQKHHGKTKDNMLGVVEATNNLLTSNILNLFAIQAIGIIIVSIVK